MSYLTASKNTIDFKNTKEVISVDIDTNGSLYVKKSPDWINNKIDTTNYYANSDNDGSLNTNIINRFETLKPIASSIAANYIVTGLEKYNDWYLPSKEEMQWLTSNKGKLGSHGLTRSNYWTSTDDKTQNGTNAISIDSNGVLSTELKTSVLGVRPIRKEHYIEVMPPYYVGEDVGYGIVFFIDTVSKFCYIASYDDSYDSLWGHKVFAANADFPNSIAFIADSNDRYVNITGEIVLGIREDSFVEFIIKVTQESFATDTQSVTLKDIIDNMLLRFSHSGSYLYGVDRNYVILVAKRIIQEIGYDVLRDVKVYETIIPTSGKLVPPIDYVEYVRLSVVGDDGLLIPLVHENRINSSYGYILDEGGYIITDNNGYYLKDEGTRKEYDASMSNYKFSKCNASGYYKYDNQRKEFILYGVDSKYSNIVMEYISDPVMAEKDITRLRIHRFLQLAIEDGIYYKCVEGDRNVAQSEVMRSRHEFYESKRKARRRFMKPEEFKQGIGKI